MTPEEVMIKFFEAVQANNLIPTLQSYAADEHREAVRDRFAEFCGDFYTNLTGEDK